MTAAPGAAPDTACDLAILVKMFPKLSETFILEEILGLERMGMRLRIYTLAPPSDAIAHAAVADVRAEVRQVPAVRWRNALRYAWVHACSLGRSPLRYLMTLYAALSQGCGWTEFAQAAWLANRLRRDGSTHLHVHFISTPADVAQWAAAMAGLPFSISAHAKDIYLSAREHLQRKLRAAQFTVTCTQFNVDTLAAIAPDAHVHRMYHGVDRKQFNDGTRNPDHAGVPLLLSVGRLRAKKGLDVLIDACRLLRDRGVAFRCEIVGYGEERDELDRRIRALGLDASIELMGKMTREQVIERYRRAAIYVQPSRITADGDRDGIPNVLLEAMAMALPVVATRVSGIPELVEHERNGLLVPPNDAAALATAVSQLLVDAALGQRLGVQARRTVGERFDNDVNLRLLCRLLRAATPRPAPHRNPCADGLEAQSEAK